MDGATIQGKVYYGYKQAALRVGLPHQHFRPDPFSLTPLDPINALPNILAVMSVATAANFNFARPGLDTNYLFTALLDGTLTAVGDYLIAPDGTVFFIGSMQPIMPIVTVQCNATISVQRNSQPAPVAGSNPYSGVSETNEATLASALPALVKLATGGKTTGAGMPSDAPGPIKYAVYLSPILPFGAFKVDDFVIDDQGRRLMVTGFENTSISLRLDTVHIRI